MLINFAIRNSVYEMLIDGSNREIGLRLSLHVLSHLHRLTRLAGCMPEIAAKPAGLYLTLRGAFQHAKFGSPQARSLSQ
jgi:hypothetical protein